MSLEVHSSTLWLTCPLGLEALLAREAAALGAALLGTSPGRVEVAGDLTLAMRLCLWSRLANRVLWPLAEGPVAGADELYRLVRAVDWPRLFTVEEPFAVDFAGTGGGIRHSGYGALVVKDAVVDAFRAATGGRPPADPRGARLRLHARLGRGRLALALDLGGGSLHRRGYRQAAVAAPLKENLAAAVLLRADWPALAAAGGGLVDPCCGGGTLLVEAALMAADIAPGLFREEFGFLALRDVDRKCWTALLDEARTRREVGLARGLPPMGGRDADPAAVAAARRNLAAAGFGERIPVEVGEIADLPPAPAPTGLLVANPPYGERWGEVAALRTLYRALGERARQGYPGWRLAVLSSRPELLAELPLRARRRWRLHNGPLPVELRLYDVARAGDGSAPTLSAGAQMAANRLAKNARRLRPWLAREETDAYRLYDADLPEYAFAVDVYGDWLLVQEYAPPPSVDPAAAARRRRDFLAALRSLRPEAAGKILVKERRRHRRGEQYQRRTGSGPPVRLEVAEGPARFEVNLSDYLDTGLFLDHRALRRWLAREAAGRRFLNLFCYTATATVQAALGGAAESLSVDLSATYLAWAERNFARNGLDPRRHRLERADCLRWLPRCRERFDLILLDPPTFSNSKGMAATLDIQRDHLRLLEAVSRLLAPGGLLFFSTHCRGFRLDPEAAARFALEEVTEKTLPPDFARRPPIHRCWLLRG